MSPNFLQIKNKNRGITMVETIIYMVILTMVMGVIVQMLVSIGGIYREIKVTRELESSGTIVMESMLREIRNASSVVASESTLGSSPGTLTISGIDENSNPYKFTYSISGGVIKVAKDGGVSTALTSSSGQVSYLRFVKVVNDNTEGVRIELELSGVSGSTPRSERFYGFSVLRGSY